MARNEDQGLHFGVGVSGPNFHVPCESDLGFVWPVLALLRCIGARTSESSPLLRKKKSLDAKAALCKVPRKAHSFLLLLGKEVISPFNQVDPNFGTKGRTTPFDKSYFQILSGPVSCGDLPGKARQNTRKREELLRYCTMPRTRSSPAPAPAASVYAWVAYASGPGDCACASSRFGPGGIHPLDTAWPTGTKTPWEHGGSYSTAYAMRRAAVLRIRVGGMMARRE